MSNVFAPFTLPLRREGDASIVDANGRTVLVVDPERDIDDDRAVEAIADHVFAMLAAAPAPSSLAGGEWSQDKHDYDALTCIAAHLRDNPAHPFSGRQCEEFVQSARDALFAALSPEAPAREGVASDLLNLKEQFERIAAKPAEEQPCYASGVRPFGTGDLRHFIETLTVAAAALAPRHEAPASEGDA